MRGESRKQYEKCTKVRQQHGGRKINFHFFARDTNYVDSIRAEWSALGSR